MFAFLRGVSTRFSFSCRENEKQNKKNSDDDRPWSVRARSCDLEMGKVFAFFENLHHPTESQNYFWQTNAHSSCLSLSLYLGGWVIMSGCRFPIWDKLFSFIWASALCLLSEFNQISSHYDDGSTKETNEVVKVICFCKLDFNAYSICKFNCT